MPHMARREARWPGVLALAALLGTFFAAPALAAEVHTVAVENGVFSPSALTIKKGDIVRWEWTGGSHTITSGSPDDETVGLEFDIALNADNPLVEITFEETGLYPYFSRPSGGAVAGLITVLDATPVNRETWGFLKKMFENPAAARLQRLP